MRTLLKTPYLHGNPLVIALVVLYAVLDDIRGYFKINLGQCPWWFSRQYLGMVAFQFGPIPDPDWRTARREPLLTWCKNRVWFKVESYYYRLAVTWETYKRTKRWVYLAVAGGVTRSSPMSGLFYRTQPGGFPVISDSFFTTGNIFFVDTGTDTGGTTAGFGQHPDRAVTDIDSAHNLCTASQGDTILVLTGHTDTISAAGGVAFDTAGITLIGLGHGAARPLVTWSATGSTWTVAGASVLIRNIVVTSSVNELVVMFSSSASDLMLDAVDVKDPGAALEIIQFLLTTAASDNLKVLNCHHNTTTAAASAQLWIRLIGCDSPEIAHNIFTLTLQNGATDATISGDGSVRSFNVHHNLIVQLGGTTQVSAILFTNGATGLAAYNGLACGSTGIAGICDVGTSGYAVENYVLNTADKSGLLDPVVDA